MHKTLDEKLARIHADPTCGDFILADAKDPDLAYGIASPGKSPEHYASEGRYRTLAELRDLIRQNVRTGLLDIMLMSASTNEVLAIHERLFENSACTPAARANDTTDIWLAQGGQYKDQPSQPFRTATIDHIMCGKVECAPPPEGSGTPPPGADLGLYSMTFNNDVTLDAESLRQYGEFRAEAERKGFRHFLEVFNPNAPQAPIADLGRFLNDMIARALGGVVGKGRPVFLKIPYHGPAAMEQLVSYDPHLVPGILGGSSGTTFDAFHQLAEAKRYGARAALYGRMINNSEHQPTFIQHLRWIADGDVTDASEAVRSYHGALGKLKIKSIRSLEDDLKSTRRDAAYSQGTTTSVVVPRPSPGVAKRSSNGATNDRVAASLARWDRVLG